MSKALDREVKKLAAIGVTVTITPAHGRELTEADPLFHLREAAERGGILSHDARCTHDPCRCPMTVGPELPVHRAGEPR